MISMRFLEFLEIFRIFRVLSFIFTKNWMSYLRQLLADIERVLVSTIQLIIRIIAQRWDILLFKLNNAVPPPFSVPLSSLPTPPLPSLFPFLSVHFAIVERMRRWYWVKGWALVPWHVNSSFGCLEGSSWAIPAGLPSSHVHMTVVVHVSPYIPSVMCTRCPAPHYNVIQYEILFPLPLSFSLFASVFGRLSFTFVCFSLWGSLISNSIDHIVIDIVKIKI